VSGPKAQAESSGAIRALKERLGSELLLLGHYYQDPQILALSDQVGDSYQLSVAASRSEARFIVFCGVRFMAESARILAKPEQRVFLPDLEAGCPLADTITPGGFRAAMEELASLWGEAPVPVLYVNSTAELKALAGEAGGLCCTSSNAGRIVARLLGEGRRVLLAPDGNLARNVADSLGQPVVICRPGPSGSARDAGAQEAGAQEAGARRAGAETTRIAAWPGFCPVHQCMTAEDVQRARERYPGCRVLVHPECPPAVARLSDFSGSTAQLLEQAMRAPAAATLVIGTEGTFVGWLGSRRPDLTVLPLRRSRCRDMARITPRKLRATLERLQGAGPVAQEVFVPAEVRAPALAALQRMITYTEAS
jgi:quinolinate synthase